MANTGVAPTLQHQGIGCLNGHGSLVALYCEPGGIGLRHFACKTLPSADQALAKISGAPVGVAFFDLGWRKEQGGARAGQFFCATQFAHVGATDGAAVLEVGESGVDLAAQLGVTRKVHIDAGDICIDMVQLVLSQHPAVAAQAFAIGFIAGGGEAHHIQPLALDKLVGRAVGRFAGGAGQDGRVGAKEIVVGQKVVD